MINQDILIDDLVQLARIALAGRSQDVQFLIHKLSKKYKNDLPKASQDFIKLLHEAPTRSTPLRKLSETPLPVDLDSRLQLLRVDNAHLDHDPILSEENQKLLDQIISERRNIKSLFDSGLNPTKSVLFTGPPGVGKTLAAKWLAIKLNRPLVILDLAAVMSSFLGRTGNNVRHVLDYAKSIDCVLLLDELDSIAKRRDDNAEIGELKRLVTVLLQEIDDWPATGLLLAATNHPDLLDPAVWRRFEMILRFNKPNVEESEVLIEKLLSPYLEDFKVWSKILSFLFKEKSYSEIERELNVARRSSIVMSEPLSVSLHKLLTSNSILTHHERIELAQTLTDAKMFSQRKVHELTGVARETIRKGLNKNKKASK